MRQQPGLHPRSERARQDGVCGPGLTIWVSAGVDHGVTNTRTQQLVLLVGLTPPPDKGAATQSTH